MPEKGDRNKKMITGMDEFQYVCRCALIHWYEERYGSGQAPKIDQTYVVWSCKALQNMKCLVSTSLPDTIYAEYTYNGTKDELYEDVYTKMTNQALKKEDIPDYD